MGRSELETPPELWVVGDTEVTVGRPDEEKLSMITNIRMAFHAMLYRDGSSIVHGCPTRCPRIP